MNGMEAVRSDRQLERNQARMTQQKQDEMEAVRNNKQLKQN